MIIFLSGVVKYDHILGENLHHIPDAIIIPNFLKRPLADLFIYLGFNVAFKTLLYRL